jgi:serine/threonine protein phosphatase PrpC
MALLEYTCFTARGGRKDNQDRLLALASKTVLRGLFAVADGMGGHRDGAKAAEAAICSLEESWREPDVERDIRAWIAGAILRAHRAVCDLADPGESTPPHTTLALLVFAADQVWTGHVGDTRASQYSQHGLKHRTRDHSVTEMKLAAGKITEQQVATDSSLNLLTRSLGSRDTPEPAIEAWYPAPGDLLVLASDGAWSLLDDDDFCSLAEAPDLSSATEKLMRARLDTASTRQDNATLVLVRRRLTRS